MMNNKKNKADLYGKLGGYRLHTKASNKSYESLFYKKLDDVAQHLKEQPSWGGRFETPDGQIDTFYDNILIDGVRR